MKILKLTITIFCVIVMCACGYEHKQDIQADSVQINHTHYAKVPPEEIYQIVDNNFVQEFINFFESLDYHVPSDESESPAYYAGLGYDYISFYNNEELVFQFTIADKFIQIEPEGIWYIMSEENVQQWRAYIEDLKTT